MLLAARRLGIPIVLITRRSASRWPITGRSTMLGLPLWDTPSGAPQLM